MSDTNTPEPTDDELRAIRTTPGIRGVIEWRHKTHHDNLTLEAFDRWLEAVLGDAFEKGKEESALRAGVATHNTVSREQIAEALTRRQVAWGKRTIWLRHDEALVIADAVIAALLVPTSKETKTHG